MKGGRWAGFVMLGVSALAMPIWAQEKNGQESQQEILERLRKLEERNSRLEQEVQELKQKLAQQNAPPKKEVEKRTPLAEAADKLRFFGYGDINYNSPEPLSLTTHTTSNNRLEVHRLVGGFGYDFTDKIRLSTEVEFEHDATEIELEYVHLDWDLAASLTFRVGRLLMPVGQLNEFHEPTLYYSVERPYVETVLIPTTWQENGAGVLGKFFDGQLAYRLYVVQGQDASLFTTAGGLHDTGTMGEGSKAKDLAVVGRLEYFAAEGLRLGGSFYYGGADQGNHDLGKVNLSILETDARYQYSGFDLRGEVVWEHLTNAESVSTLVGQTIGTDMFGWYAEAGYHLLPLLCPETKQDVVAFLRHEEFDTNFRVPTGFTTDRSADRKVWTFGVAYYPLRTLVFKADYEYWEDGASNTLGRFNLGVAFTW